MEIQSSTEEHSFHYEETYRLNSYCEGCKEKIVGDHLLCQKCGVEVHEHESCVKKLERHPHEITHPLHSHHPLTLRWDPFERFICAKCLCLSKGSYYGCNPCNFTLDLTCASLTNDQSLKGQEIERFKHPMRKRIKHCSHAHQLQLFNYMKIITEPDYDCHWCEKPLLEMCYGCLYCNFFLHEFCASKIPKTLLNHPFHPMHSLRLRLLEDYFSWCDLCGCGTSGSPSYGCQACNISLDFYCAKLSPTLKSKSHDHRLIYFKGENYRNKMLCCRPSMSTMFTCKTCLTCIGSGDTSYHCIQCSFRFHITCILPLSVEHRYHRHPLVLKDSIREDDFGEYYCDVCEKERNPNHHVYWCEQCSYMVHIECTEVNEELEDSKTLGPEELQEYETINDNQAHQQTMIRYHIHEHPLEFYKVTEDESKKLPLCSVCCLVINDQCYMCDTCFEEFTNKKFYIHEKCADLPQEMRYPLHPHHNLNLYAELLPKFVRYIICDECRDISDGFIYLCEECDFKLDAKCAASEGKKLKEDERRLELLHFGHKMHKLVLGCNRNSEIDCSLCELPISGEAYFCPFPRCVYKLHKSCFALPQEIQVSLHSQHMLVFNLSYNTKLCDACALPIFGSGYSCELCDLGFHSICTTSVIRALKFESHIHDLYYFGPNWQLLHKTTYDRDNYSCCRCRQVCVGQPFYRCLTCQYNFHLECASIPQIVKSRCHIHPFTLKDSFIEDDSGEYYCNACEEERCPIDHIYFCEECDGLFVAHIECVLDKLEEVFVYLAPRKTKKSSFFTAEESDRSRFESTNIEAYILSEEEEKDSSIEDKEEISTDSE